MKPLTGLSDEDEVGEHLCLPPEVNPQQPNPLTTEQQAREEQKKEVFTFCLFCKQQGTVKEHLTPSFMHSSKKLQPRRQV